MKKSKKINKKILTFVIGTIGYLIGIIPIPLAKTFFKFNCLYSTYVSCHLHLHCNVSNHCSLCTQINKDMWITIALGTLRLLSGVYVREGNKSNNVGKIILSSINVYM